MRRSLSCGLRSSYSTSNYRIWTAWRSPNSSPERPPPPAVVLISSRDAAAYGPRLQATPARGFIPKRELSGEALAALTS